MTNIITRYFETASQARAVKFELVHRQRFSVRILDLYDTHTQLADTLIARHVNSDTAHAYQERLEKQGGAVLLVRAGYRPLSVAKTTRQITAAMGAADMGGLVEEVYIKDNRQPLLSVLEHHPTFLVRQRDPDDTNFHMTDWLMPLISRRTPFNEFVFPPHARMSDWPFPLISRREPYNGSIFPRHARMANVLIPLLSSRQPRAASMIPLHGRMANMILPLVIQRPKTSLSSRGRAFSLSKLLGLPTILR